MKKITLGLVLGFGLLSGNALAGDVAAGQAKACLLYTSPSPRDT